MYLTSWPSPLVAIIAGYLVIWLSATAMVSHKPMEEGHGEFNLIVAIVGYFACSMDRSKSGWRADTRPFR